MTKKPLLTISLLASNRPDTIRRCLDSVRLLMDKIPSELILVDTSKSENIHEILSEYTNQVYDFEWCNDFAKARNVGLKKAQGEWFLFLDDDEWFHDIEPIVEFFQSGEYKKYAAANYRIRNFTDVNYEYYSDAWVSRMVRIQNGVEFRSKIHEYIYGAIGEIKNIPAMVYHSGYIYATEEQKEKHFERNTSLLKQMISEEPDNQRWRVQLIQEYRSIHRDKEMLEEANNCIANLPKDIPSYYATECLGTFYAGKIEALIELKQYEEARKTCEDMKKDARKSPIYDAYAALSLAEVYFLTKEYAKAIDEVKEYLRLSVELGENKAFMSTIMGMLIVFDIFEDIKKVRAYSIWIASTLILGDATVLREHISDLMWDRSAIYVYKSVESEMLRGMSKLPYEEVFTRLLEQMYSNKQLRDRCFIEIQLVRTKDKKGYDNLMKALSYAKGEDAHIWEAKVLYGEKTLIDNNLQGYYRNTNSVFDPSTEISNAIKENGLCEEDYWTQVPFVSWMLQVDNLIKNGAEEELTDMGKRVSSDKIKEDIRSRYAIMKLSHDQTVTKDFLFQIYQKELIAFCPEEMLRSLQPVADEIIEAAKQNTLQGKDEYLQVLEAAKENKDKADEYIALTGEVPFHQLTNRIYLFCNWYMTYMKLVYTEDALMKDFAMLASKERAALWLNDFFYSDGTIKERMQLISNAAKEAPELADLMKELLKGYANTPELMPEQFQLMEQIKNQVLDLYKQGSYTEALDITLQLRKMNPMDIELIEWEEVLKDNI